MSPVTPLEKDESVADVAQLMEAENRLTEEVDHLKQSLLSDSLKVSRLETLLTSTPGAKNNVSREMDLDDGIAKQLIEVLNHVGGKHRVVGMFLSKLFRLLDKLEKNRQEREQFNQDLNLRLQQIEEMGAKIERSLKTTQDSMSKWNFLSQTAVIAVPLVFISISAINYYYSNRRK